MGASNDEKKSNKKIVFICILVLVLIIAVIMGTLYIEHNYFDEDDKEDNSKISRSEKDDKSSDERKEDKKDDSKENKNKINKISSDEEVEEKNISIQPVETEEKAVIYLSANKKQTVNNKYSINYLGSSFEKVVNPPNTSGYYSYYDTEEGHQYLVVRMDYENLESNSVRSDRAMSCRLKYANKYEYTSFAVILDQDNDFTYSNITNIEPLTTGHLYYLFDVPDVVATSKEAVVVTVVIGNDNYKIKIR